MSTTMKSRGADRFQTVKSQLQRETAQLLAQRRSLQGNVQYRPPIKQIFTESAALTPVVNRTEQEGRKTQEVISRLQQIIRLCKEEGALSNEEMREVVKVENQVLNYLQRTNAEPQAQPQKPYSDTPQGDKEKVQANHTWGKPPSNPQENILSQDTLEIIAEIERKALSQIIHLQKERDSIKLQRDQLAAELGRVNNSHGSRVASTEVQRLREENRMVRQENRLLRQENNALNVRLSTIGPISIQRPQYGSNDFVKEGLSSGQYNSQINVYENQLKRASAVIVELKSRLSNVAGLEQLHEQGERIRRETAQLLQYKSRGADDSVIRELQERLEEQERGKAAFLQELKNFKMRFIELQEENRELKKNKSRVNFNSNAVISSPPREYAPTSKGIIKKRSGLGDYENTLNELKQALR